MQELLQLWCKSKGLQYEYDSYLKIHYFINLKSYENFTKGNQFKLYDSVLHELEINQIDYLLNTILNKLGVD